jgi:thiamine pyrophosphokinase
MRAIIFANGQLEQWPAGLSVAPQTDLIIAADGGLEHCLRHGLRPHVLVGDLDSLAPARLASLAAMPFDIQRHPREKDYTDLELALRAALRRGADQLLILGALGGRSDMTLSNVLLLAAPFLETVDVRLLDGAQQLLCLHGGRRLRLRGRPGARLSLLPLGAAAVGITLTGLAYRLEDATLEPGSTRGVSNTLTGDQAEVRLRRGCLLVALDASIHTL